METKRLIVKYLLIVIGLAIVRVALVEFMPSLFAETIVGVGFTKSEPTFFGIYQRYFFNMILAMFIMSDLSGSGRSRIVVPVLAVVSASVGLTFFSLVILFNFLNKHEQFRFSKDHQ